MAGATYHTYIVNNVLNMAQKELPSQDEIARITGLDFNVLNSRQLMYYPDESSVLNLFQLISETGHYKHSELSAIEEQFDDVSLVFPSHQEFHSHTIELLNKENFYDFLMCLIEISESFYRHLNLNLFQQGKKAWINITFNSQEEMVNTAQGVLTGLTKMIELAFPYVTLNAVYRFNHASIPDEKNFVRLNGDRLSFSASYSAIEFDRELLKVVNPVYNPAITQHLKRIQNQNRHSLDSMKGRILQRLEHYYQGAPLNLDANQICHDLHVSNSTLSRKLKDENTSYKKVLEEFKQEKCLALMKQNKLSLSQISDQLGYANNTSFNRAFKRWFNQAPSDFKFK